MANEKWFENVSGKRIKNDLNCSNYTLEFVIIRKCVFVYLLKLCLLSKAKSEKI